MAIKRTCDVNMLNKVIASDKLTIVVGTQKGCRHCPPHIARLQRKPPAGVAIVEVPSANGKPACEEIHKKLNVKFTPHTNIYRNGRKLFTFQPKSADPDKNYAALVARIAKYQSPEKKIQSKPRNT